MLVGYDDITVKIIAIDSEEVLNVFDNKNNDSMINKVIWSSCGKYIMILNG